jgi:NTE family protein
MAGVQDFDRLGIPFRAVTTDLETGESVVLGAGDLVTAIRASMSIPAVLDPVELDGRLLVDGGLTSNLPIREARALGADVVIAVDVGARPLTREELTDPFAVANQAINLLMVRETERQIATLGPKDILLQPDLKGVATASFLDSAEIIPRGVAAARAAADRLRQLSLPVEEYAELRRRQSSPSFVPPEVTAIHVTEDAEIATGYITSRLRTEVGQRVDIDTLYTDLERVYGLGVWESVYFRLVPDGEDRGDAWPATILEIHAREKAWGTSFARLGIDLVSDFDGATSFDLGIRYTAMPINKLGGEWRTDLSIGELLLVGIELYQPLNIGGFFVAPRAEYRETNFPLLQPDGSTTQFRLSSLSAALDVGRELGTWGEVRLGLDHRSLETDVVFGPEEPDVELDLTMLSLRFATDTLDDSSFPTRGVLSRMTLRQGLTSLEGEVEDLFAEMQLDVAQTFGRHTFNLGLEAAGAVDDEARIAPYTLGGFLRLSGLHQNELRGDTVFLSRLIYFRHLGGQSLLGQPIYAGFSIEGGNAWPRANDFSLDDLVGSGSLFFGADTVLGPAYVGVGFAEQNAREYYVLFGRRFGRSLSPIFD